MRAIQEGQTLHITLVRPARPRLQVVTDLLARPNPQDLECAANPAYRLRFSLQPA